MSVNSRPGVEEEIYEVNEPDISQVLQIWKIIERHGRQMFDSRFNSIKRWTLHRRRRDIYVHFYMYTMHRWNDWVAASPQQPGRNFSDQARGWPRPEGPGDWTPWNFEGDFPESCESVNFLCGGGKGGRGMTIGRREKRLGIEREGPGSRVWSWTPWASIPPATGLLVTLPFQKCSLD